MKIGNSTANANIGATSDAQNTGGTGDTQSSNARITTPNANPRANQATANGSRGGIIGAAKSLLTGLKAKITSPRSQPPAIANPHGEPPKFFGIDIAPSHGKNLLYESGGHTAPETKGRENEISAHTHAEISEKTDPRDNNNSSEAQKSLPRMPEKIPTTLPIFRTTRGPEESESGNGHTANDNPPIKSGKEEAPPGWQPPQEIAPPRKQKIDDHKKDELPQHPPQQNAPVRIGSFRGAQTFNMEDYARKSSVPSGSVESRSETESEGETAVGMDKSGKEEAPPGWQPPQEIEPPRKQKIDDHQKDESPRHLPQQNAPVRIGSFHGTQTFNMEDYARKTSLPGGSMENQVGATNGVHENARTEASQSKQTSAPENQSRPDGPALRRTDSSVKMVMSHWKELGLKHSVKDLAYRCSTLKAAVKFEFARAQNSTRALAQGDKLLSKLNRDTSLDLSPLKQLIDTKVQGPIGNFHSKLNGDNSAALRNALTLASRDADTCRKMMEVPGNHDASLFNYELALYHSHQIDPGLQQKLEGFRNDFLNRLSAEVDQKIEQMAQQRTNQPLSKERLAEEQKQFEKVPLSALANDKLKLHVDTQGVNGSVIAKGPEGAEGGGVYKLDREVRVNRTKVQVDYVRSMLTGLKNPRFHVGAFTSHAVDKNDPGFAALSKRYEQVGENSEGVNKAKTILSSNGKLGNESCLLGRSALIEGKTLNQLGLADRLAVSRSPLVAQDLGHIAFLSPFTGMADHVRLGNGRTNITNLMYMPQEGYLAAIDFEPPSEEPRVGQETDAALKTYTNALDTFLAPVDAKYVGKLSNFAEEHCDSLTSAMVTGREGLGSNHLFDSKTPVLRADPADAQKDKARFLINFAIGNLEAAKAVSESRETFQGLTNKFTTQEEGQTVQHFMQDVGPVMDLIQSRMGEIDSTLAQLRKMADEL